MATVTWTPQARKDVEAAEDYYRVVAPAYADVVVAGLLGSTQRLGAFPRSGRAVPEVDDETVREVIYREYRVIYFYDEAEDHIDVLSVLHSAKQFGGGTGPEDS